MFGLGFWEIAIILAIALIVLGPSKLPELAKGLGKGLREFRKATEDFKSTIEDEMYKPDHDPHHRMQPGEQAAQILPPAVPPVPTAAPAAPAPAETHLPPPASTEPPAPAQKIETAEADKSPAADTPHPPPKA
jgi:TatA/E family protein of Tat protein translocase